jgi:hypothetical protein
MLPNFLVIGAAKAGTTALHWYLSEHPAVFISRMKDPSYFAYGVDASGRLLWGEPEHHRLPVRSLPEYESLFDDVGNAVAVGEASTMYLECPQAAARIREVVPDVRMICSLRQPVERAYSDYLMYLRRRGRRFEPARDLSVTAEWAQPDSRWMQIGRYHQHLAPYYERFPRDQMHVSLFDDLRKNALGVVQDVYRFLGVDPTFVPDFDTPHAPGGVPKSMLLEGILTNQAVKAAVEAWVPKRPANWVRRLRTRNMKQAPSLPAELRHDLTRHFRDEIMKTSDLIGRSLEHWL